MNQPRGLLVRWTTVGVIALAAGCDTHDEQFIPYELTGMNAWVYDAQTDASFVAGFAAGDYDQRASLLASCAAMAETAAVARGLNEWSYVCCTVTDDSACSTKVR